MLNETLELLEKPRAEEVYMLAGWRQWADAGTVSSALPRYLIEQTNARRIGRVFPESFYLFQVPGTQDFLRPEIKLENGYRKELQRHENQIFYSGNSRKGLVIFVGDEPHLNAERYADVFFTIAREMRARRVISFGGVYASVPYDTDRQISCTYSLPRLKDELNEYAVRFSNYEGGVSIGSYLVDRAEQLELEYVSMYAFVPMYDLTQISPMLKGLSVEQDWKAWYDIMRRVDHMCKLGLDLSHLETKSRDLIRSVGEQIDALEEKMPDANVREFLRKASEEFEEQSFMPLDDVWQTGLDDIFRDS